VRPEVADATKGRAGFGVALAVVLLVFSGLVPSASGSEPKTSVAQLEDEVMCVVCGTLLGLSQAPAADRQREFIQREIDRGRDREQIKASLVEEYGPGVLAMPEGAGIDLWAYLLPLIGLGLGVAGVAWFVYRWRRSGSDDDRDDDRHEPPAGPDAERLERELADFRG
jgi:cytochrome c-type biogenesis protein CcmH